MKVLGLRTEHTWLRTGIVKSAEIGVDRENKIIKGYSVITKGEALGHDFHIDDTFLDQVVAAGNKSKAGIKSRFDHPNASSTSMGKVLGRSKNFRKEGDQVRADLHLLEAASHAPDGDLAGYVMDLAQEDPGEFGASIVFQGTFLEEKDESGRRAKGSKRLARLEKLLASDVVDDPAANPDGFLSAEESLAAKATEFLDLYFANKGISLTDKGDRPMEKATPEQIKALTAEEIKTGNEKLYSGILEDGAKAERARVLGIQGAAFAGQENLVKEMIELGASVDEAKDIFIADEKKRKSERLEALKANAPRTAGGGAEERTEHVDLSNLPLEERCKAEWEKSPELREEFPKLSTYQAFKRAEEKGQVKILKK